MPTSPTSQRTDFSVDVLGRYLCNGYDEVIRSSDPNPRPDLGRPGPRPDARPFDVIVLGGGTFGAAVAQHLFANDVTKTHRILVIEGGPFVLPEHTQNLPMVGLGTPDFPTSVADFKNMNPDQQRGWSKEVWGLSWHSNTKFPGLAYCIGGRSLYWGGWSPVLLDDEMPTGSANGWPTAVVNDLKTRYFKESSDQIGVSETNDFIYGPLHFALRQRLFDGIGTVTEKVPLNQLPDHPAVRYNQSAPTEAQLKDWLGLPATSTLTKQQMLEMMKLEAPLAVESQTDPGCFPINKFSSVPLLVKASRSAQRESNNDDVNKRLMVLPYCHISKLGVNNGRVTSVETNLGPIPVAPGAVVILALATIESTRLALNSFQGIPNYQNIGRNLMAHLRSNLTIRIRRVALPNAATLPEALQTSALFVKGRHTGGGRTGTFHLQITASGLNLNGTDSEAELWQKVPDIDHMNDLRRAKDESVVITIRAIGEMEPQNPNSKVIPDPNGDADFGTSRAFVSLAPSTADEDLWKAMDKASDEVAKIFANGIPFEVLKGNTFVPVQPNDDLSQIVKYIPKSQTDGRRDGMGTTHHETGTLWMGTDPQNSVTNTDARFHFIDNAYVVGPSLLPSIGSPNPMLSGIALARRLADHLIPPPPAAIKETGFKYIFDGTLSTFEQWKFTGSGRFEKVDRALVAQPQDGLGLFYFPEVFGDFTLRLDFMLPRARGENNDNSGIFLRFNNPQNAITEGYEVQLDEEARGDTRIQEQDGFFYNRTGAIYKVTQMGTQPGQQQYQNNQQLSSGRWNQLEIKVSGNVYDVKINGQPATRFINNDANRGKPGFIGLQSHTGRVAFANIRVANV
jgi:choline dehydrogenase-like flavoprotein